MKREDLAGCFGLAAIAVSALYVAVRHLSRWEHAAAVLRACAIVALVLYALALAYFVACVVAALIAEHWRRQR